MPKVLVVDDSLSVRKVVERALEPRQIEVVTASSGAEALERLEREQPDVVICDVVLPDKDGYEVCQFVRAHARLGRTPVLLISGIVDERVRERAAQVRSNGVMFKPFSADTLVRKVDELLAVRVGGVPAEAPGARNGATGEVVSEPVTPVRAASASERAPGTPGIGSESLKPLTGISGIRWALLIDHEGFVIEKVGESLGDGDAAGALASCLTEASAGIGRELGQGALQGMILEYEAATLLVHSVNDLAVLVVSVADPAALGKARYYVRKALPGLRRAL
jgi:CheY-like chemotaxis protein/predicted regulator of Ras-like GTPase activity (Roadblock/LC7/MglB family)